ncbi:ABC transporter, substrate-binding protein (cluster 4, leucine/isoleucine/valine/benzoate) [hydrothermal vent metagenome]|uniref:ABC transporter, substrate-binding protein (Cluster 4, leucine/isoleucine/valine/benzoate) n=1 Tax=hydrothermal vent metagenome TaxID=652676 RepID=A0A3B0SXD7_9ZZZZ
MQFMAEKELKEQGETTAQDRQAQRRGILKWIGMTAFVFLAGCESIVPRGAEPPPTAPTPPPVTGGLPTDAKHHRIALLVPLSGKNAGVGQSLANATTMALLDTKAENIRMTSYDTAKGVTAAARKAISDGNKLILGPLLKDNVVTAANIARPAGVPILSFSNDTGVAGNNVFILGHIPSQSINRVVDYAKSKGMTRFAALVPNGVYGQRASSTMLRKVRDIGGTMVAVQTFNRNSSSMEAATRKLSQNGAFDAVLLADNGSAAIKAAPYIRKNASGTAKILGTDLWNTSSNLAGAPAIRGAWFASVADGLYGQYANKYRGRYGKAPFRLSSLGYDSVLLTVKVAQNWKVGTPFPIRRLTDPGGFIGLDGVFRFKSSGISERALEVQEIRRGSFAVIDPAPKSF